MSIIQGKRTIKKSPPRIPRPYGINLFEGRATETDSKSIQNINHPPEQDPFFGSQSLKREVSLISQYLNLEGAHQVYEKQVILLNGETQSSSTSKKKFSKRFRKNKKNPSKEKRTRFGQYSISDELKWKCGCGKVYSSYPALYLHRKNKHPSQTSGSVEIIRPVNHARKGRPKNVKFDQDWETRIQTLALKQIQFDARQWTILTILTNQHSISAKLIDNALNRELLSFMEEFSHPFSRVCAWLLNYHIQLFLQSSQNEIYQGICISNCESLPLMSNIMANWWNMNEELCLFSHRFLVGLLQIFLQKLMKEGKTDYFTQKYSSA